MKYDVVILAKAEADLNAAVAWIKERAPAAAERWFNGFVEAILALERHPTRCGLAPENEAVRYEIRQPIYLPRSGRPNRALFTVVGDQVRILRIRRPGQPLLQAEDLL